jgi:hypothetical protein
LGCFGQSASKYLHRNGLFIRFQLASDQLVSSPPFGGVVIDDVTVLW